MICDRERQIFPDFQELCFWEMFWLLHVVCIQWRKYYLFGHKRLHSGSIEITNFLVLFADF